MHIQRRRLEREITALEMPVSTSARSPRQWIQDSRSIELDAKRLSLQKVQQAIQKLLEEGRFNHLAPFHDLEDIVSYGENNDRSRQMGGGIGANLGIISKAEVGSGSGGIGSSIRQRLQQLEQAQQAQTDGSSLVSRAG